MPANLPWQQIERELGTEEAEKNHPAYVELPASIHTVRELIKPMITAHRFDDKSILGTMVLAWIRRALLERLVKKRDLADKVWGWSVAEQIQTSTSKGEDEVLRAIVDGFALALSEAVLDEFKV
jgi:hypothetical protein